MPEDVEVERFRRERREAERRGHDRATGLKARRLVVFDEGAEVVCVQTRHSTTTTCSIYILFPTLATLALSDASSEQTTYKITKHELLISTNLPVWAERPPRTSDASGNSRGTLLARGPTCASLSSSASQDARFCCSSRHERK
ncbi:hypothetical protein HBI56_221430 [Parastagonospora nodorum]|nr:hypothetical protein HBI09_215210 [Parastagonospora nodorum]KAH4216872.1 hypothetical protein HBI06_222790 [Parastagonospora nodorum]KAH4226187.1 hypothetical protein HBI05_224460 [Parastagonospora nodorum]KAH4251341.1 hypothetical protein HBI03_226290 [Parastagonospora nodorum]KAH4256807.1 hypothetical protein HBI04_226850 [Parastagonospora nodorum]